MTELSYQLLRKNVEHRLGVAISSARECQTLSQALMDVVQAKVSVTTIKRFWGIVSSDISPSKFTLNAMARYIGYEDFADFEQGVDADTSDSDTTWEKYRAIAREITEFSLNCVKSRMGPQRYSSSLRRDFTRRFFEDFRASGKVATAMVAPSCWGKTVNIAHIVDEYFMAGGSRCYGDLLFYFDTQALRGFSRYTNLIEELFISMLGSSGDYDFKSVFMRHPNWRKGHVYIFIDTISTEEQLNKIISLVNIYNQEDWLHVVFTTRPTLWILGSKWIPMESQSQFYGLECVASDTQYCNVPSLSLSERFMMLHNSNTLSPYSFRLLYCDETQRILGVPGYMSIMMDMCLKGDFSVTNLMWSVFKTKLASRSPQLRLAGFLSSMVEAMDYGRKDMVVMNSRLFQIIENYREIFEVFCTLGTIKVRFFDDRHLDLGSVLSFSDSHFFDFLIFSYWINLGGTVVDLSLMERVAVFYGCNDDLKLRILTWMVRYIFREELVDCINGVFDLAESVFNNPKCTDSLRSILCSEYASHPGLRQSVMRSDAELIYYMSSYMDADHLDSTMRYVATEILSRESCRAYHLRAYMVCMYSYFIDFDRDGCAKTYARMTEFLNTVTEHSSMDYLVEFGTQMMMEGIEGDDVSPKVLSYVEDYACKCFSNDKLYDGQLLGVGYILIDTLVLTHNYAACRRLTDIILQKGGGMGSGYVYNIATMMNISSLLHSARIRECNEALSELDLECWLRQLPDSQFFFFAMRLGNLLFMLSKAGCHIPVPVPLPMLVRLHNAMLGHTRHERIQGRFKGD